MGSEAMKNAIKEIDFLSGFLRRIMLQGNMDIDSEGDYEHYHSELKAEIAKLKDLIEEKV